MNIKTFKHEDTIDSICFSNDEKFMFYSDTYTIYVIDLVTKRMIKQLIPHNDIINYLCINPKNNNLISCSFDGNIKIIDINTS